MLLQRLSDEVLTIIATIGCAGGVAMPSVMAVVMVLLRRAERSGRKDAAQGGVQYQVPPIIVQSTPPPALPQYPQPQYYRPPVTLERQPVRERRFVVMGEEE